MSRMVEAALPERLGRGFRWLVASSWVSNLGDGLVLAAGPLLVASLTQDARLVALAATLQWLPPLLFSLVAGVVSDRVNRWHVLLVGNLLRIVVLTALTLAILTEQVSIAIVLGVLFLLGCAEVFVDNTASTVTPMLVDRPDLAVANARIMTGFVTLNQLAGPPLGAFLFTAGHVVPFGTQIVLVASALVLLSRIRLPEVVREERRTPLADAVDGLRWVVRNPAVRTLVLTIFSFNITFGAVWAVLVLYARQQLGMGEIGFGLITTASAAGGLAGTLCYGWLTRRMRLSTIMRIGLIIETLTHLSLAVTRSPWVAMPIFVVFGAHAFVWGTTSVTIRQRVVPTHLQGRVSGVNAVGVFGGLVLGSLLAGVLAEHFGVAAPFWFAGAGSAIFLVAIWRELRHIAHTDDRGEEPDPPADAVGPDPA